jgi:RNA-splicing ligase RtcB
VRRATCSPARATAYKDITPVVQAVEDAAIARRVAWMGPLPTIKG